VLRLEVVVLVNRSLEHSGTSLAFTGLALTSANDDVNGYKAKESAVGSSLGSQNTDRNQRTINLVDLKGDLLNSLVNLVTVDDGLVAVNDEALQLMREDGLNGLALELLSNLGNNLSAVLVLIIVRRKEEENDNSSENFSRYANKALYPLGHDERAEYVRSYRGEQDGERTPRRSKRRR
jgi:hypothetical protein